MIRFSACRRSTRRWAEPHFPGSTHRVPANIISFPPPSLRVKELQLKNQKPIVYVNLRDERRDARGLFTSIFGFGDESTVYTAMGGTTDGNAQCMCVTAGLIFILAMALCCYAVLMCMLEQKRRKEEELAAIRAAADEGRGGGAAGRGSGRGERASRSTSYGGGRVGGGGGGSAAGSAAAGSAAGSGSGGARAQPADRGSNAGSAKSDEPVRVAGPMGIAMTRDLDSVASSAQEGAAAPGPASATAADAPQAQGGTDVAAADAPQAQGGGGTDVAAADAPQAQGGGGTDVAAADAPPAQGGGGTDAAGPPEESAAPGGPTAPGGPAAPGPIRYYIGSGSSGSDDEAVWAEEEQVSDGYEEEHVSDAMEKVSNAMDQAAAALARSREVDRRMRELLGTTSSRGGAHGGTSTEQFRLSSESSDEKFIPAPFASRIGSGAEEGEFSEDIAFVPPSGKEVLRREAQVVPGRGSGAPSLSKQTNSRGRDRR